LPSELTAELDAGDPGQAVADILVGEAGDIVRNDRVDDGARIALAGDRGLQRGAGADDDDVLGADPVELVAFP
jgi:hypothetical protein